MVAETPKAGVNLVGFFEAEIGLGEVARKLAKALEHAAIPYSRTVYRRPPSGEGWEQDAVVGSAPYDTNVVCLNPDYLHQFLEDAGRELLVDRYTIGVWFWETNVLRPADVRGALFVDEVWVASEYVREAVAAAVDVPVHVVPLPIEEAPPPMLSPAELGLPEGFVFLYVFDFLSAERKNPSAVVDAFARAFSDGEGPLLVLKSVHGEDRKPKLLEALKQRAAGRSDVIIRDGRVPVAERDAYVAACDCYVSLHRSEGFGLTMAEAMAYGKPVIATGYSGNLEFMNDGNAVLVPYRLIPVPKGWWAYEPGAVWAEPDIEAAATAMRHVWLSPEGAEARVARARISLAKRFALSRTAAFLQERLTDARARGSMDVRTRRHDLHRPILVVSRMLTEPPGRALDSRPRLAPTTLVRRLLRRALWPVFAEQRRVDTTMLDAVSSLSRYVADIDERLRRLERQMSGDEEPGSSPSNASGAFESEHPGVAPELDQAPVTTPRRGRSDSAR